MKKAAPHPVLVALQAATHDGATAVRFFEDFRWRGHPACPRCGSVDVRAMESANGGRHRDFRWRCLSCRGRFTVRTGTIFEGTRLPMRVWAHAMWRVCASKKGVSALQVKRETQISYKSALYLLHRIRFVMAEGAEAKPIGGYGKTVEADETYVGGKLRRGENIHNKRGRGTSKTPVIAMVERGGNIRFRVMERVTAETLGAALAENVDPSGRLMTDALRDYREPGRTFYGGHEAVNHTAGEYVRGDAHNNTAESAFSLLKRGMMGTFHSVTKYHLHRYLAEFAFRWNTRYLADGDRAALAVRAVEGKRLRYRLRDGDAA